MEIVIEMMLEYQQNRYVYYTIHIQFLDSDDMMPY